MYKFSRMIMLSSSLYEILEKYKLWKKPTLKKLKNSSIFEKGYISA